MTNFQSDASDRAKIEAQIALAHALKIRRGTSFVAKVKGIGRNLKSLMSRNRITTGLSALLIVFVASLIGMAWRVQEAQTRALVRASVDAVKTNASALPVECLQPAGNPNPAMPAIEPQITVSAAELLSDSASPALRMDYQLSQPTPKGTTP